MAKIVEIAELMEKHGKDWRRHYNPGARGRFRVFCLYLGVLVAALEFLGVAAAPVMIAWQGAKIARLEKDLAAERRLVDKLVPSPPMLSAHR